MRATVFLLLSFVMGTSSSVAGLEESLSRELGKFTVNLTHGLL